MSGTPKPAADRPRYWRIWICASVLVPVLLFAAAAWHDREVVLGSARERVLSTTDALAAHAEAVLETAAVAVASQLQFAQPLDWAEISRSRAVHDYLAGLAGRVESIESAFYVDPEGYNSASSREFPMPRYDVRDREYYKAAKAGDTGLVISAPFNGRARGDLGFTVSRARIVDGRFDGLAAVTLHPTYFQDLYQSVLQMPRNSDALLVRQDGTVLARYHAGAAIAKARLAAGSPEMLAAARADRIAFETGWSGEEGPKVGALHWLAGRRIFVVAEIDRARVLREWYFHCAVFAVFALLATLALVLSARTTLQRAAREQESLQALVAETGRRRQAEAALQQSQKMDALGRLTGGVAHDFNNLLTAVLGSLELALRRTADPDLRRLLEAAKAAGQRGARLTGQMLAFARKQSLSLEPLDGNAVVREMDELLNRSVGPLVRLSYDLEALLWPVMADRVQLELALLNLVVNAHDAMPQGGEVTVGTRNVGAGDAAGRDLPRVDHVAFWVGDTGEGMSEAVRASAFEPFFTTKGPGRGTGLGLSMVYGFARQAGGTVRIDSAPGRGTCVTIYLPRSEAPVAEGGQEGGETTLLPGIRLLLVDDDESVREPTAAMLGELGCAVTEAGSGAAALRRLRQGERFDALVVDFAMPGMDGGRVIVEARQMQPGIPVVLLTGYSEAAELAHLRAFGVPVVAKPFRLERLASAVSAAIRDGGGGGSDPDRS